MARRARLVLGSTTQAGATLRRPVRATAATAIRVRSTRARGYAQIMAAMHQSRAIKYANVRACRDATIVQIVSMEGRTAPSGGDRRRLTTNDEMKQVKVDKRMKRAANKAYGNKMGACMDAAAAYEGTDSQKDAEKDYCRSEKAKKFFSESTGNIGNEVKDGDAEILADDAMVEALMEANRAVEKAKADHGETFDPADVTTAQSDAIKRAGGGKSEPSAKTIAELTKKAGAKAIADKAAACVVPNIAQKGCADEDLMEDIGNATGMPKATDAAKKKRQKREGAMELLKDKLKACGPCTDDDDDDAIEFLGRTKNRKNDKKQAISALVGEMAKFVTFPEPSSGTASEREAAVKKGKRDKVKAELKRLKGLTTEDVTDEQVDGALDLAGMEILDAVGDCDSDDKVSCHSDANVELKTMLGCKDGNVKTKKNQIARLAAGRAEADAKAAGKTEAEMEAAGKAKYEDVAGDGAMQWDDVKADVKRVREAYGDDKEIIIKKKKSVDVIVEYDATSSCDDTNVLTEMKAVEFENKTLDVVRVGVPFFFDTVSNKCRSMFRASVKPSEPAPTDEKLKGAVSDAFIAKSDSRRRRLNERRLSGDLDVSADQSTEVSIEVSTEDNNNSNNNNNANANPGTVTPSSATGGDTGGTGKKQLNVGSMRQATPMVAVMAAVAVMALCL